MNTLDLPIPLFFILQLFISIVCSQGASSTVSSSTSSGSTTTTGQSTATGTATSATNSSTSATNASATSSAQFPSLSGVSTCVSNCLAQASANLNCTSEVQVNCFCVNPDYPAQLVDCVLANCSNQVSAIETLGQQFCNLASGQPTLSFPPVPTTTTTSTTSASTSAPSITTSTFTSTSSVPTSSATTTSSAASSWKSIRDSTALMGLGVIIGFGVVLGV